MTLSVMFLLHPLRHFQCSYLAKTLYLDVEKSLFLFFYFLFLGNKLYFFQYILHYMCIILFNLLFKHFKEKMKIILLWTFHLAFNEFTFQLGVWTDDVSNVKGLLVQNRKFEPIKTHLVILILRLEKRSTKFNQTSTLWKNFLL